MLHIVPTVHTALGTAVHYVAYCPYCSYSIGDCCILCCILSLLFIQHWGLLYIMLHIVPTVHTALGTAVYYVAYCPYCSYSIGDCCTLCCILSLLFIQHWGLLYIMLHIVPTVHTGLGDSLLVLSSDSALNGTGMKALNYILKHIENEPSSRFNSTHLKHFLFNMVPPAVMLGDASIELCSLMKRGITDVDVLSRMVQIGTRFRIKDLKELVLIADESDNLIEIISSSMSCFTMSNAHLKSAAEVAIKVKKFKFLACLIKHGAAPATTGVVSLTNLIDPVIINYIFANASPDKVAHFLLEALSLKTNEEGLHFTGGGQRCEVDWGEEIENEQRKAAWIVEQFRDFVQCGKSLCGKGTVAGIREILSLVLNCDVTKAHLELVCQLLNCGANSLDLCRARFKKTTPLHAATMLALESGMHT